MVVAERDGLLARHEPLAEAYAELVAKTRQINKQLAVEATVDPHDADEYNAFQARAFGGS